MRGALHKVMVTCCQKLHFCTLSGPSASLCSSHPDLMIKYSMPVLIVHFCSQDMCSMKDDRDSFASVPFGELLNIFRKRQGMRQQTLAARLGVHRNTVGVWERGDCLPESKTMVLEIARQLLLKENETRQLLEASLTALSPYWHVPYQRNPFFTGREHVLVHLHTVLIQGQAIAALTQSYALHGLGGI